MKHIVLATIAGLLLSMAALSQSPRLTNQNRHSGLKFVSFNNGIYTFEHDHTVIRAKCRGMYGDHVKWTPGECPLGSVEPGQIIPDEFPLSVITNSGLHEGVYFGLYANLTLTVTCYDSLGVDRLDSVTSEFHIISWKIRN